MMKFLPLLAGILLSIGAMAQTDLFFSEYIEGTGNNKALEIYNPTNKTIDLSKYYVARYSNGATTYTSGGIVQLSGTIAPYKTHVLVNGQTTSTETSPACDPLLQAKANQLDVAYPAATYMNGNDAIALLKSETNELSKATAVDLIGQIGMGSKISAEEGWAPYTDTIIKYKIGEVEYSHTIKDFVIKASDDAKQASYGPYWLAWTQDHTLRRKPTVKDGVKANPAGFNVSMQWDTLSVEAEGINATTGEKYTYRKYKDIWDGLGKHACVADPNYGTKVSSLQTSVVRIYPTTVMKGSFVVESSKYNLANVKVYNICGQQVFDKSIRLTNRMVISMPEIKPGIYLVHTTIADSPKRSVTRIIVQ